MVLTKSLLVERSEKEIIEITERMEYYMVNTLYKLRCNTCNLSLHDAAILTELSRNSLKKYEQHKQIPMICTYCKITIIYITYAMDNGLALPDAYSDFIKMLNIPENSTLLYKPVAGINKSKQTKKEPNKPIANKSWKKRKKGRK